MNAVIKMQFYEFKFLFNLVSILLTDLLLRKLFAM